MLIDRASLVEADVDWLTVTSKDENVWKDWLLALDAVRSEQELQGNVTKQARLLGYLGQQCAQVFTGYRPDGYMARLSGRGAGDYGLWFWAEGRRVTRIDLQATWEFEYPDEHCLDLLYASCLKGKARTGRPITVSRIQVGMRTETIYIGRRSSPAFFRIYDKGVESSLCPAGKLIRWEGEYKDELATSMAEQLYAGPDLPSVISQTLAHEMRSRGLPYPSSYTHQAITVALPRPTVDLENTLKWFAGPVASSVARAVGELGIERVLRALFSRVLESTTDADSVLAALVELAN